MARVVIMSANPVSFEDERTKRLVEGTSVQYFDPGRPQTGNYRGYALIKGSLNPDLSRQLRSVPGVYDMDFDVRPGRDGAAQVQIGAIKYVAAFEVEQMVPADV